MSISSAHMPSQVLYSWDEIETWKGMSRSKKEEKSVTDFKNIFNILLQWLLASAVFG
jgi:hypothetical protein